MLAIRLVKILVLRQQRLTFNINISLLITEIPDFLVVGRKLCQRGIAVDRMLCHTRDRCDIDLRIRQNRAVLLDHFLIFCNVILRGRPVAARVIEAECKDQILRICGLRL